MKSLGVSLSKHRRERWECKVDLEGQMETPQLPILHVQKDKNCQGLGMPSLGSFSTWQLSTSLTSPQRTRSEQAKWDIKQSWATLQAPPLALSIQWLPSEEKQARKRTAPPHTPRHFQLCQLLGIFFHDLIMAQVSGSLHRLGMWPYKWQKFIPARILCTSELKAPGRRKQGSRANSEGVYV